MSLSESLKPANLLARLGVFSTIPNAMARANGLMKLTRFAVERTPAPVAPTASETILVEGCSRLMRYAAPDAAIHHTDDENAAVKTPKLPILLIPSLINRYYVLDLKSGISVVEMLRNKGHHVYIVDWGEPTSADANAGFAQYALHRLRKFIDAVLKDYGTDELHLLGHCLGGTMCTSLAALDPRGIRSLVNLTAPISFHDDGVLSAWSRAPFFDAASFAEVMGNIPPWITQPSFLVLKPMGQPSKILRLWQNLGDDKFLDFFRCLETWVNDNVSIPKKFYVDLIERLYRENALLSGNFVLDGKKVILEDVKMPVFTVTAQQDHIVPPQSAIAGHQRFPNEKNKLKVFSGGHIGVVVGGAARKTFWPELHQWFLDNE